MTVRVRVPSSVLKQHQMKNLEVKLFVVATLLQELIDATDGKSQYKNNLKFHLRETQKALDKLLSVPLDTDRLSLLLSEATQALEESIDKASIE